MKLWWCTCWLKRRHELGTAQFDDTGSDERDLDTVAGFKTSPVQPVTHQPDLGFKDAFPKITGRFDLQRAAR